MEPYQINKTGVDGYLSSITRQPRFASAEPKDQASDGNHEYPVGAPNNMVVLNSQRLNST